MVVSLSVQLVDSPPVGTEVLGYPVLGVGLTIVVSLSVQLVDSLPVGKVVLAYPVVLGTPPVVERLPGVLTV